MKGKSLLIVAVLMFAMLSIATNTFALPAGTPFDFSNTVNPGPTDTWTHTLSNSDFTPNLSGGEILDITKGYLELKFTFTPAWIPLYSIYGYSLELNYPTIDGIYSGETFVYSSSSSIAVTTTWSTEITVPDALQSIEDKSATVKLVSTYGTINNVDYSTLSGKGTVAPEPVSMLLVGIGLAGLPLVRRFRGFREKLS